MLVLVRIANTRSGYAGATHLISAPDGYRIVPVTLADAQSRQERIMYFGHELQHAREIADAVDVRDQAAMRQLMERIGRSTGHTFETNAAIAVGRQAGARSA